LGGGGGGGLTSAPGIIAEISKQGDRRHDECQKKGVKFG